MITSTQSVSGEVSEYFLGVQGSSKYYDQVVGTCARATRCESVDFKAYNIEKLGVAWGRGYSQEDVK